MYHKATLTTRAYYDTKEEMPTTANVYFPNEKEPKEMNVAEMFELSKEGWLTIKYSSNMGVCDHWISESLSKWVREKFLRIVEYVDSNNNTIGFNRLGWSVNLTKEKVFESEVWNS